MAADLEQEAKELFRQAAVLPAAQRNEFLRERCADVQVRERVVQLLEHDDIAGSAFLRGPAESQVSLPPAPQQIGRFRILSVLGHGGMGTVYEAEQDKPHRKVALKVIRPGWMSHAMLRRFEYEAEVLARLDHPGIARIYDAGTADSGHGLQPYFAMELVQGKRLDQYIRQTTLPLKERLKLLIEICQAVHHAHTKGVIHRDLKPSNIIITSERTPKILDFGVARATDSDIQSTTLHTESGQIIGTLPYMAPEQASGRAHELDTSSDVYALGVIAYELLSGKLPYALQDKPLHEAVRVICEDEPSRLSSIDKNLRGDVETIVGKALEKDKTRRYHTAGEFAADVKRYLDYEPITARPPGTWYQVSKFAKRNKFVVASVALVLLAFGAATAISTWQAILARNQAEIANAVRTFLTDRVLAGARPERLPDKTVRDAIVKAMLDPAAASIEQDFKDKPATEVAVRNCLAHSYQAIGRADLGFPHAEAAVAVSRRALGDDHPDTLDSISTMGTLLMAQGKLDQVEPLWREALERMRLVLGDDHPDTLKSINNMACVLQAQGKLEQSEPLYREALERYRRVVGNDHWYTLISIDNMGGLLQAQGKLDQAEPLFREALERSRRVLGDDHPKTLTSIDNMGGLLQAQRKLDQAEPLLREALERKRRVLGDDHPDTMRSMGNMGGLLLEQGRLDQADPLFREALDRKRRVLGDDHLDTLRSINHMGRLLQAQGKLDQAEPLYRQALDGRRRVLGDDHPDTLISINHMGQLLQSQGKLDQAEPLLREAVARYQKASGSAAKPTTRNAGRLADLLDKTNRHDEAAAVRKQFELPEPATRPASLPSQPVH